MFVSRYHNLIQLAIFAFVCDVCTTEQHLSTNMKQDNYPTFYIRLARSPGDQPETETVLQESEKTTINEESDSNQNKNTDSNSNIEKESNSTISKDDENNQSTIPAATQKSGGKNSRKNSDKDKEDPPPTMTFPPGVQTMVASQNGKATLFLGMFQVIMMPMPSGPGAGVPAIPGGKSDT